MEDKFYAIVFSGQYAEDYSIEDIYYSRSLAGTKFKKKLNDLRDRSGWNPTDMLFLIEMPMRLIDEADELLGTGTSTRCGKLIRNNADELHVIDSDFLTDDWRKK